MNFYTKLPDMECLSGDTLPTFHIQVTGGVLASATTLLCFIVVFPFRFCYLYSTRFWGVCRLLFKYNTSSADIYSIVETAKTNGLDVFKCFELLLIVLPSMTFLTNQDILEEPLP